MFFLYFVYVDWSLQPNNENIGGIGSWWLQCYHICLWTNWWVNKDPLFKLFFFEVG